MIEEKLIDNNSNVIIKANTTENTKIDNTFFSSFFSIFKPAFKIKKATQALIHKKA